MQSAMTILWLDGLGGIRQVVWLAVLGWPRNSRRGVQVRVE